MNPDLSVSGASTSLLIIIGILVGILLVLLIASIFYFRSRQTTGGEGTTTDITKAFGEINKLKAQNDFLWERVTEADRKFLDSEEKRRVALGDVARLTEKVKSLTDQLEAKNLITPIQDPKPLCVLGVWPEEPGLDPKANADALAVAGVEYTGLSGPRASMEGITYALPLRDYSIIEIGAKGDIDGIRLADGLATTQWWVDLAKAFKISTFILLSDLSGVQDATSIGDRLFQTAVVRAVISLDGRVEDLIARRFARRFYAALGQGETMAEAFIIAKIAVGAANGGLFRLREKAASGD